MNNPASINQLSKDDRFAIIRRAHQATQALEKLLFKDDWSPEVVIGYLDKGGSLTESGWDVVIRSGNEAVIEAACESAQKMKNEISPKTIFNAAAYGSVVTFKVLTRYGFDVNKLFYDQDWYFPQRKKKTVLAIALREGRDDLVEWLLDEGGADPANAALYKQNVKGTVKFIEESLFNYVVTARGVEALKKAKVSPHYINSDNQNPIESFLVRCGSDLMSDTDNNRYARYEKREVLSRLIDLGVPTERGLSTRKPWSALAQGLTVYPNVKSLEDKSTCDFFLFRKSKQMPAARPFFAFQQEVLSTLVEKGVQWPEKIYPLSVLDAFVLEKNGVHLPWDKKGSDYLLQWIENGSRYDKGLTEYVFTKDYLKYLIECGLDVNQRHPKTGRLPVFSTILDVLGGDRESEHQASVLIQLSDKSLINLDDSGFTSLKNVVNRAIQLADGWSNEKWQANLNDFEKKERAVEKQWLLDQAAPQKSSSPARRRP